MRWIPATTRTCSRRRCAKMNSPVYSRLSVRSIWIPTKRNWRISPRPRCSGGLSNPSLVSSVTVDGDVLGLPYTVEAGGVIYNKELLSHAVGPYDPRGWTPRVWNQPSASISASFDAFQGGWWRDIQHPHIGVRQRPGSLCRTGQRTLASRTTHDRRGDLPGLSRRCHRRPFRPGVGPSGP